MATVPNISNVQYSLSQYTKLNILNYVEHKAVKITVDA